eukprot:TRINITY_DN3671_c0_g1_i13.p1 TRINITY_DN3671_c0_g1~~TRINITY_DN3671_c0_g1_i13.p1  ORF type:complete len:285 (-),score=61.56 TRINITY_DN3671_c0_g1_i13:399-1253(-)
MSEGAFCVRLKHVENLKCEDELVYFEVYYEKNKLWTSPHVRQQNGDAVWSNSGNDSGILHLTVPSGLKKFLISFKLLSLPEENKKNKIIFKWKVDLLSFSKKVDLSNTVMKKGESPRLIVNIVHVTELKKLGMIPEALLFVNLPTSTPSPIPSPAPIPNTATSTITTTRGENEVGGGAGGGGGFKLMRKISKSLIKSETETVEKVKERNTSDLTSTEGSGNHPNISSTDSNDDDGDGKEGESSSIGEKGTHFFRIGKENWKIGKWFRNGGQESQEVQKREKREL